jgi:hypothetical protein
MGIRHRHLIGAVAFVLSARVVAADGEVPLGMLEGRIVEGATLWPVEGATIVITDTQKGPVVASGTTDPNGWFHYRVPPGTYDILAIFGDARWIHLHSKVERNRVTQVPGTLRIDAEMITVHEKTPKPEHRGPQAIRSTVKPILPYSDQAIDENAWAVGWMLLDVDEGGVVTGFRFLHKPGYGLDKIAENEIWGLRFRPAVDAAGQPMPSKVLWKLEWPAFHYAKDHKLLGLSGEGAVTTNMEAAAAEDVTANHYPTAVDGQVAAGATGIAAIPRARPPGDFKRAMELMGSPKGNMNDVLPAGYVLGGLGSGQFFLPDGEHKPPCKGSGPMNLDMHEALYRDCAPPDLGKVNSEPVVPRPPAK